MYPQVGVRYGKKLQPDAIRLLQLPVLAGQVCAHLIRKRVSETGETATGGSFGQHSDGTMWVAPGLPQPPGELFTSANGKRVPANSKLYESDQYHRALHGDDKYRVKVTGGMWDSLSVSVANSHRVAVIFRRSSLGFGGKRVLNRTKASKAQELARAPYLEPSDPDVQAALDALGTQIDRTVIAETVAAASRNAGRPIRTTNRRGNSVRVIPGRFEVPT